MKMKKLIVLFSLMTLLLTSCGIGEILSERFRNSRTRLLDSITSRDDKDYKGMLDAVFAAVDSSNQEELKTLFAVTVIEANSDIDSQIGAFFQVYKGPMEIEDYKLAASGSEHVEYGKRQTILHNAYSISIVAGGVRYHVNMTMCSKDDFNKDEEGIHWLEFATDDAYSSGNFVFHYEWNSEPGFYYQDSVERRDDLRWIDGRSWKYTYYDRTLTPEDLRAVVEKDDDFSSFVAVIGEPNCAWDIYEYYYYELENGLWAVVKVDRDLRPRNYFSNGKIVELNIFKPNAIVAIYIADEKNNLETIWMANDIVKVWGSYRYFSPIDRQLSEDIFKSFVLRSSSYEQLTKEIGPPNIDETWYSYYELSDGRFVLCHYFGDDIEEISVVDSEDRLYTIFLEKSD